MIDLWAAVAAAIAAGAIAIRANMLKPHHDVWAPAPWWVCVSLVFLAIVLGMSAVSIASGESHATAREALVYTVLALTSSVMLFNLQMHGRLTNVIFRRFGPAGLVTTLEVRDPVEFMKDRGRRRQ